MTFYKRYTLGLLFLVVMVVLVKADGFNIREYRAKIQNNVITLDARLDFQLSETIIEALHNGIDLELLTSVALYRPRAWRKDKRLVQWQQMQILKYHSLTDRYLLDVPGSGAPRSFATLNLLFADLSAYHFQRNLSTSLFEQGQKTARVKLKIAVNRAALPAPLRVLSYVLPQWRNSYDESDWLVQIAL